MRILISPLNWGLGHASRCIPIIKSHLSSGDTVFIGGDGVSIQFLKKEFPTLNYIKIPSLNLRYSASNTQVWAILLSLPSLLYNIVKEHFVIKKIVQDYNIDLVISDNRFGLWTSKCKCVYITHQIMVRMPKYLTWAEYFGYRIHGWFIKHYNECWIPDYDNLEHNLSGDLSHKFPIHCNCRFIGPLSRLNKKVSPIESDVLVILSGLEPQRTILEQSLIEQKLSGKVVFVRGVYDNTFSIQSPENYVVYNNMNSDEVASYILGAKKIICRSGYSSIMDLEYLDKLDCAELIPTPGQTEQEYLAYWLSARASSTSSDTIVPIPEK